MCLQSICVSDRETAVKRESGTALSLLVYTSGNLATPGHAEVKSTFLTPLLSCS